jgi:hypothetical protein
MRVQAVPLLTDMVAGRVPAAQLHVVQKPQHLSVQLRIMMPAVLHRPWWTLRTAWAW